MTARAEWRGRRFGVALGAGVLVCLAVFSVGSRAAEVRSGGCTLGGVAEWGRVMVRHTPEVALANLCRAMERTIPDRRARVIGPRVYAPEALLMMNGLSPVGLERRMFTWLVLIPVGEGGTLFWAALSPDREGVVIRYGAMYLSRRLYLTAQVRRLADRVLPEGWRSPEWQVRRALAPLQWADSLSEELPPAAKAQSDVRRGHSHVSGP